MRHCLDRQQQSTVDQAEEKGMCSYQSEITNKTTLMPWAIQHATLPSNMMDANGRFCILCRWILSDVGEQHYFNSYITEDYLRLSQS